MHKISLSSRELQANFSTTSVSSKMPWTKRAAELSAILTSEEERTYHCLQSRMHQQTRLCFPSYSQLADDRKVHRDTVRRHVRSMRSKGIVQVHQRPKSARSNDSNAYFFPELTPDFLYTLLHRGGCMDAPVKQVLESKNKQQLTPPTPLPGGGVDRIEPERPKLNPEVHKALQEARAFRAQRKAERRQRRYSEARADRRQKSPAGAAVRQIQAVLQDFRWGTRLAIQTSVSRFMSEFQVSAESAANKLVAHWLGYRAMAQRMEYPCGAMTWFTECRWREGPSDKHLGREMHLRSEGLLGSRPRGFVVDVGALQAKMSSLMGQFGVDLEGEDDAAGMRKG